LGFAHHQVHAFLFFLEYRSDQDGLDEGASLAGDVTQEYRLDYEKTRLLVTKVSVHKRINGFRS
jgi:hypothetical protein